MTRIKLLWVERRRVWRAYKHFRKYHGFYTGKRYKQLEKLFGRKHRAPTVQAIDYVLNNIPSFDLSYFPDMEKSFNKENRLSKQTKQ